MRRTRKSRSPRSNPLPSNKPTQPLLFAAAYTSLPPPFRAARQSRHRSVRRVASETQGQHATPHPNLARLSDPNLVTNRIMRLQDAERTP